MEIIGLGDDSTQMFPGMGSPPGHFDYVNGRPLKINIAGDEMETWLYNRDQGEGKAEKIVAELRSQEK